MRSLDVEQGFTLPDTSASVPIEILKQLVSAARCWMLVDTTPSIQSELVIMGEKGRMPVETPVRLADFAVINPQLPDALLYAFAYGDRLGSSRWYMNHYHMATLVEFMESPRLVLPELAFHEFSNVDSDQVIGAFTRFDCIDVETVEIGALVYDWANYTDQIDDRLALSSTIRQFSLRQDWLDTHVPQWRDRMSLAENLDLTSPATATFVLWPDHTEHPSLAPPCEVLLHD